MDWQNVEIYQVVARICEKYGCTIDEIDFENHILNIEGPEDEPEKRAACVRELEEILEMFEQEKSGESPGAAPQE